MKKNYFFALIFLMGILQFKNISLSGLAKKSLLNQALDANARFGAGVIKASVNVVGAIDTKLGVSVKLKAFEDDLTKKIELNYKKSMAFYRTNLLEKEKTLTDEEKYLAHLFVQFNFNSLYLYNEQQDRLYVEKIVGFLKSKDIKIKINKYIKAVLLRTIPSFEKLIDQGYQYYITNSYNPETEKWTVTLSEKKKIAYQFLYEFAKDVLAYQMAIKEVDQELTTLKRLSDKIITYIKSDAIQAVSQEKQKVFLEPLYQTAYFLKIIRLENFDSDTIIRTIKELVPSIAIPSDPALNEKYVTFMAENFSNKLSSLKVPYLRYGVALSWLFRWGFSKVPEGTKHTLAFALRLIYPDITVGQLASAKEVTEETARQLGPKAQKIVAETVPLGSSVPIQKLTQNKVEKVLESVGEQIQETLNPLYKGSGLISKIQEKEPTATLTSSVNAESQPQNDQNRKPQKSFFDRLKDYLAPLFNWMWE